MKDSGYLRSLPEVLGKAALYFDPENPDQFAEEISRVAHDPSLRERLKVSGYRRMRMFSWKRMAEETLAAYEQAIR